MTTVGLRSEISRDLRVAESGRREHQSVDSGQHPLDRRRLALTRLLRLGDDERVAGGRGRALRAADDAEDHGVGDVGDHQPERVGPARRQRARDRIDAVVRAPSPPPGCAASVFTLIRPGWLSARDTVEGLTPASRAMS